MSHKWSNGEILSILLPTPHFSVLAIKKVNAEFKYVQLCNEGRPITAFYEMDLDKMSGGEITPRHGIMNENSSLCDYHALEFVRILIFRRTITGEQLNHHKW